MIGTVVGTAVGTGTLKQASHMGFSGGSDSKESACNAGDSGWIPESRRCPGDGNGHD